MNNTVVYLVFSAVIIVALVLDLGLLSKKNKVISLKQAMIQTLFWVLLSFAFGAYIWITGTKQDAVQYISAYLLEWSLSIDNIFVFIIIFSFFKVKPVNYSRVLLMGILMAIVFRIIFITLGSELVAHFDWIMYVFGAFLIFTGIKMFASDEDKEFNPEHNWAFRFMKRVFPTTTRESNGKFFLRINNKLHLTTLAMVVVMLGLIDIVFAIDSIPAVFSIIPDPSKKLLIYSSNIFAVLGLRSLFFLLRGAAEKFSYLQQGIAVVLLIIGAKMILEPWLHKNNIHIPVWGSLVMILVCIGSSILYSIYKNEKVIVEEKIESADNNSFE